MSGPVPALEGQTEKRREGSAAVKCFMTSLDECDDPVYLANCHRILDKQEEVKRGAKCFSSVAQTFQMLQLKPPSVINQNYRCSRSRLCICLLVTLFVSLSRPHPHT